MNIIFRATKLNRNYIMLFTAIALLIGIVTNTQAQDPRQRTQIDANWKFALGHPSDVQKDFGLNFNHFTSFAKAGYGDGAAAKDFDDRAWRVLDVPHDWCVELPFDSRASASHGFNAIGKNFPENSVGWYRKKFFIPTSDLGKRISIEFDGVHRNSIVWVNGFYLGTEQSGSSSFAYDITDYLVYGQENVIAVRADATIEEGWYYEGAGIYRHVWLTKTEPLHVARHGTFITTKLKGNSAVITARTNVLNENNQDIKYDIEETILDATGKVIASGTKKNNAVGPGLQQQLYTTYTLNNPTLWSLENPSLHKLKTVVRSGGKIVDTYETVFGIRTVRFDANEGFFLNGKHVKIVGSNNHQDHAGVGTAIPDALQEWRIKRLKEMGSNAIRTSHNPPTPEFLEACDRLGVLVMIENRLMGINQEHLSNVERLIKRDRNHPSVIIWSLGNEEWHIEGDIRGARLAASMQTFANRLDSSRAFTIACSGGWDTGIGMVTQVMGFNYLSHGDIDAHHAKFPWQASIGTEESNTIGTRGIYETDTANCHLAPSNIYDKGAEGGWKYYAERPYLSGLFYWTGFDYRGEPTPYDWPATTSQFGIIDLCGFPKDIYYYMKSWWVKEPVLHLGTQWNQVGKEGKEVPVIVYSNCEQVELFLNNKSLGKKSMPVNSHLEWKVLYQPGVLMAKGYKNGKEISSSKKETSGSPAAIKLTADRSLIKADGQDVSVITVEVKDIKGLTVPVSSNEISFSLTGPGRIIGVGNGNPSSHEPEQYHDTIKMVKIRNLKEYTVSSLDNRPEVAADYDDSKWIEAFSKKEKNWKVYNDTLIVVRGVIDLPYFDRKTVVTLFTKSIAENQSIYVNGHLIKANVARGDTTQAFVLDHSILKPGKNVYAITGKRFRKQTPWEEPNTDPGLVQLVAPAAEWKRKVFNGYAQIIVQSDKKAGALQLTATSPGLKTEVLKIQVQK